jgi:hypothetical protein
MGCAIGRLLRRFAPRNDEKEGKAFVIEILYLKTLYFLRVFHYYYLGFAEKFKLQLSNNFSNSK